MITTYASTLEEIESSLVVFKKKSIKSFLVLCASHSLEEFKNNYLAFLNKSSIPFFGGVFPSLIFQSEVKQEGIILIGLEFEVPYQVIDLGKDNLTIDQEIINFKNKVKGTKTLFCLISAFGDDKSLFLNSLFNNFANLVDYIGAGCGDLSFSNSNSIIASNEIHKNAAVVASIDQDVEINHTHGWEAKPETYKVTQIEGNEILSIDWKPAVEVYMDLIQQQTTTPIDLNNLEDYIKYFPFGISRMDNDLIIRDPYAFTKRGGILVVDKIDEGEYICLMEGNSECLISACKELHSKKSDVLVFNCISRLLFHEKNIAQELQAISKDTLIGAFSIGEIVNTKTSFLEMYNKIVATLKI